MILRYDQSHPISYGYYICPICGSAFYGGGPALHNLGCTETGYENCDYYFGPKQVEAVIDLANRFGPDRAWYGITFNDLKAQFPELLERAGLSV